ncbi:MAG: hypothetical protein M2R45_04418 [Verrucomicrobia subdivision 3 bacterium]|nr:hypothetical protein [Limisphaerales bacterium]MCS1413506.1 hypothetical protein [Limisphaerales bacterium]
MGHAITTGIGLVIAVILFIWHRHFYDYQITRNHLTVTWLEIPIRRIRLADIESISKRRKRSAENWANTWRPRHRILVIRRKTGFFKHFIITPAYRYEFQNQLETAMERLNKPRSA